jgi:beta-xylosidase
MRQVLLNLPGPIEGGGVPHQGGLVQTQNGDWYYASFVDAFPGGRMPALAPIKWTEDGWPTLRTVDNAWGKNYSYPDLPHSSRPIKPMIGSDLFNDHVLGPEWEWNHNPDTNKYSVGKGLKLQTATVTSDLYSARNTLTRRIQGPMSTATIKLDYRHMKDGDRAGLALFRDLSAWIGVRRDGGKVKIVMVSNLAMDNKWNTTSTGTEEASAAISGKQVWLRVNVDIRPGSDRQGHFSYSTDGVHFTSLGSGFTLKNDWRYFMGYRFGIFNYATESLGGEVTVSRFDLTAP